MSGAPLFTLVIFYFHEGRQHNIDDVELIYSSDFHEGRQYFVLMLVTTVTSQVHSARHHQRAGYSALPSV